MAEYPVLYQGERMGTLRLERAGERMAAELDCLWDQRGLFRAFLLCRRGEISLGVLEPKNGRLRLSRRFAAAELDALGGAVGAEMRLSFAFTRREGWQNLGGPFFCRACPTGEEQRWPGAMWRHMGEGKELAVPYDGSRPFPLCALFCFARIRAVEGRPCAVFAFDAEERPVMPEKDKKK